MELYLIEVTIHRYCRNSEAGGGFKSFAKIEVLSGGGLKKLIKNRNLEQKERVLRNWSRRS